MSQVITIDIASRIAKRHGYRNGQPVNFLNMMQIVGDAYAAGYDKAVADSENTFICNPNGVVALDK